MNNVTDLSPNFEIATDNQPIEILATTQIKAVIKQHQVFVKIMPVLSGATLLAALLLFAYLFHLKSLNLMAGYGFAAGLVLTLLLAGVGAVLVICFVSMGLGKFNQELWLVSGINQFESSDSNQQCKEKMLFLAEIYKMMGEAVFYLSIASVGLVAWCVKDGQQALANQLYASIFALSIILCMLVFGVLFFKTKAVRKIINSLF